VFKLSKIFLDDILPSTGTAVIAEADFDPATGLLHYGDCKVVHISRVREATAVPVVVKPVDSTPAPSPIVRKGPQRK